MAKEKIKEFLDDYEDDFYPKKEPGIQIPDFALGDNYIPSEEQIQMQAMLNNTPNNTDLEKINHLAELERACQNWDAEEWLRVILHADAHMMLAEVDRRIESYEKCINGNRANLDELAIKKL